MAMRWKKNPKPTGLARIGAGPQSSVLREGGVVYATVYAKCVNGRTTGWYFVTNSQMVQFENTCNELVETEALAKANAMAFVCAELKEKNG